MTDPLARSTQLPAEAVEQVLARIRERTPARLFHGRSGLGYRTATQLELRADHAAARDAVQTELTIDRDFPEAFLASRRLVEVFTQTESRQQFLARPDLGRRLDLPSKETILKTCSRQMDIQIVIGDGLSSAEASVEAEAVTE